MFVVATASIASSIYRPVDVDWHFNRYLHGDLVMHVSDHLEGHVLNDWHVNLLNDWVWLRNRYMHWHVNLLYNWVWLGYGIWLVHENFLIHWVWLRYGVRYMHGHSYLLVHWVWLGHGMRNVHGHPDLMHYREWVRNGYADGEWCRYADRDGMTDPDATSVSVSSAFFPVTAAESFSSSGSSTC